VLVVLLVLLVVVGGGAFLLTSGGDDDEGGGGGDNGNGGGGGSSETATPDTPEGAVQAFFAAAAEGDCAGLADVTVQNSSRDEMVQACQSSPDQFSQAVSLVDVGTAEVDASGTAAVVDVTFSYMVVSGGGAIDEEPTTSVEGNETTTVPVTMTLDGDTWRLDVTSFDVG
jgi:hypothetical protein